MWNRRDCGDDWTISSVFLVVFSFCPFMLLGRAGELPTSVLAPLGSLQLVFNALFASLLVGDHFNLQDLFATVLVTIGAAGVAFFGFVEEEGKRKRKREQRGGDMAGPGTDPKKCHKKETHRSRKDPKRKEL